MIFSFVAGFLRFTLSFSIFSSSFIILCFLFSLFFPVVFLCMFNPFSLSISFHFLSFSSQPLLFLYVTLSSLLSALCSLLSLSLSPLLYSFSSFSILGCRVIYCQSPRRKWESALHHSKSHPAVRRESVREGRVREERRSKSSRSGEVIRIQRCMMMQLLSTLATLLSSSLGFGTWPGS